MGVETWSAQVQGPLRQYLLCCHMTLLIALLLYSQVSRVLIVKSIQGGVHRTCAPYSPQCRAPGYGRLVAPQVLHHLPDYSTIQLLYHCATMPSQRAKLLRHRPVSPLPACVEERDWGLFRAARRRGVARLRQIGTGIGARRDELAAL